MTFYDHWSYFQTYFSKIMCIRLSTIKPLPAVGENHTLEKLTKPNPKKPNLFLDCLIKMLFEYSVIYMIYASYNFSNIERKKKLENNKYIFKKVSICHTVAAHLQYFNIYFIQTLKWELLFQEVVYVCLFSSLCISDVKSAKQYFHAD